MKNKPQKNYVKVNLGLSLLFTLAVLIVLALTAFLTSLIGYALYKMGAVEVLGRRNPFWLLAVLTLVSLAVSTILSFLGSRFTLKPVQRIINGINQLAQGNFDVRLEEQHHNPQLTEMITSFNALATELSHTELLRNDFINNFSHEFKTPIVSIKGFAEMMRDADLPKAKQDEYLAIIIDETSRLSRLSTSILNLSKVENQTIVPNQSPVNIGEQIRNNIILLQREWEDKDLTLSLSLEDVTLVANGEMLSQVWFNLIDNAVKFSPVGGDLIIHLETAGEEAVFTIVNGGPAIPAEQLPYIFNKFYQGDTSHQAAGNGIGLPLVKRIVALHQGSVSCHSSPEQGTEFKVRLPLGWMRK